MEKWVEIHKEGDVEAIAKEYGISPITARILVNRDILGPEIRNFLSPGPLSYHDPFMLKGMERVVCVLGDRIEAGEKIRIIGDYDVDGICATYILFRGLKMLGADADYDIPDRVGDGYGINERLIDRACDAGRNTIITCDNGISAIEAVKHANDLGMTVIVTDHHEPPYEETEGERYYKLPDADAIVNPKLPGDQYPFKGICGAMVALKVIIACAQKRELTAEPAFIELFKELTEFAALATICDVMELRDENRAIVRTGLKLMAASRNLGMRTLIDTAGLAGKSISAYHAGFIIGPCLNASGRLDSSLRAVSLFEEKDPVKAKELALELVSLNDERKNLTVTNTLRAFDLVEKEYADDKVLVVYLDGCHESIAGIIAGKVREKFKKPAFIITDGENCLKGSGRSIEAYNMHEGLVRADSLLIKYGGHRQAAGLSLAPENLPLLREQLNRECNLSEDDFCECVKIDTELSFDAVDTGLLREIERLEPFGTGNETPVFSTGITIISGTKVGKNRNVGKYRALSESGRVYDLVYFGDLAELEERVSALKGGAFIHSGKDVRIPLRICYRPEINEYKGNIKIQFQMRHYKTP